MFVNILPQRSLSKSVLSDDDPKLKNWSKDQGFSVRNDSFPGKMQISSYF